MSLISESIFVFIKSKLITIIPIIIIYYLSRFYLKVWSLPPGPLPIPFFGNLLFFRGTKRHSSLELMDLSKKYGPVFTFWFGNRPFIIITDSDIAKETFRKNDFSGRPESFFGKQQSNEEESDIAFADFGQKWESLRRVAHSAVRKFANTEKLALLVTDVVDNTVETILEKEGINKPFDAHKYIYHIFLNIMSTTGFGKRYTDDDKEFKQIKSYIYDFFKDIGSRFAIWEFIPITRVIDWKLFEEQRIQNKNMRLLLRDIYENHCKTFNENIIRDFNDALIIAKKEALAEGKESAQYLTDNNLIMTLYDLLVAGTDTTQYTFYWMLKIMVFYPEIQTKLRQEIETEIGDRMPTQEDRNRCHYTNAFISESMRFRNVLPTGVFHKTVKTSKIGNFAIPKGTGVCVHQFSILNDEKYWEKPNEFIAERFLENGKYVSPLPSAFIPFSVGRRVCLGEKLALADLFLVLVRFLQKTNGYEIVLYGGQEKNNLDINPINYQVVDTIGPNDFKIIFKQK